MSRRTKTLVTSAVLVILLGFVAFTLPVPYVILSPGPTLNTLGTDNSGAQIIVLNGRQAKATTGHLNLTTVSEQSQRITSVQALIGWLKDDQVVVPRASIFPPGQSQQQVDQQNTQDFSQSQDSATAAAACELGYPKSFGVSSVDSTLGAAGQLKSGDKFVSVDGVPVATPEALSAALKTKKAGDVVTVVVDRNGVQQTAKVKLGPPAAGGTVPRLGVVVTQGCLFPFGVDLGLGNQIGGPSAGLMFALGIMDKVGTADLTNGKFIAGTGEISPDGTVGPIGGIALKMIAARRAGATVFLAPAGNCSDVKGNIPDGLNVVKVETLHGAVQDLKALQEGQPVPHC
ncbi:PDZ domain-containing protein [Jatrophihabitans sp. GAS493]|uniref:YlbL family protein n=1 Tax=Jatrophihabitans sp. GAS493 TaxID=1907575 RepID=UPI000BB689A1|nr:S16 family serine protease [Jatrophihabitans sp. GAS493]SOD73196.1 PDZ domain-containing protein [Jatrophihabitans sp. GAS493]